MPRKTIATDMGNTSSSSFIVSGDNPADLFVGGTLDGATVVVESKGPDDAWYNVGVNANIYDGSEGSLKLEFQEDTECRITASGGGASVAIDAWVQGIESEDM